MPCMCWFHPDEASKKLVKDHCQAIVDEVKRLESIGDPVDLSIDDIKELIEHLYNPKACKEKRDETV
jgi:hypothetical protein